MRQKVSVDEDVIIDDDDRCPECGGIQADDGICTKCGYYCFESDYDD